MHDTTTNRLWTILLPEPNHTLPTTSTGDTQAQMVAFAHTALVLPTLATIQQAIDADILLEKSPLI